MNCAYGENLLETQFRKLQGIGFDTTSIHLVDGHQHRLAAAAQALRRLAIEWNNAFLHVDYQKDYLCRFDRDFHLRQGSARNDIVRFLAAQQADAAGIDQGEGLAAPFRFGGDPITRHTGLVMDDRDAAADDAIKQRRLTDVGTPYDGDGTRHEMF